MVKTLTEKDVMQLNYETAKLIAECTDGKLSVEDVINLTLYGARSPMEFAPEEFETGNLCMCGTMNCPEAYEHMTSGC